MRLINTTTLKLEGPFFGAHLPQYAILSHTWGDEELCLQDMADLSSRENNRARALQDGYDHVWIDTVCIDKTSSAELSEAINSMYEWYAKSTVCYAFLEDFSFQDASLGDAHSDDTSSENSESLRLPSALYFQLSQCRWFTRGWTLQELIAPKRIVFFDKDWIEFGDRSDLTDDISAITGIDVVTLAGFSPRRQSVAYRMSWASRRTTTRPEDLAYCLLGVFGVNMPMLYGEGGERAFIRLQEEILRKSDDTSIFAWSAGTSWSTDVESGYWSLLAPSPSFFEGTFDVSASRQRDGDAVPSISITNRGISLRTRIHVSGFMGLLGCRPHPNKESHCMVRLSRLRTGRSDYARDGIVIPFSDSEMPTDLDELNLFYPVTTILVPHGIHEQNFGADHFVNYIRARPALAEDSDYEVRVRFCDVAPVEGYDFVSETIRLSPFTNVSTLACFSFKSESGNRPDFQVCFFCAGDPQDADCLADDKIAVFRGIPTDDNLHVRHQAFSVWDQNGREGDLPGELPSTKSDSGDRAIQRWELDHQTFACVSITKVCSPLLDTVASAEISVQEN